MFKNYILPILKIVGLLILQFIFQAVICLCVGVSVYRSSALIQCGSMLISTVLVMLLFFKFDKTHFHEVGVKINASFFRYLIFSTLGVCAVYMLMITIFNFAGLVVVRNMFDTSILQHNFHTLIGLFLEILSFALIFYGYIYSYLNRKNYSKLAIGLVIGIISSFIIQIYNIGQSIPIYLAFFYIIMGVIFTAFRYETDSIWPVFLLWYFWESSSYVFNVDSNGSNLITGGTIGLKYGLGLNFVLILILIAMIVRKYAEGMFFNDIKKKRNLIVSIFIIVFGIASIYKSAQVWQVTHIDSNSAAMNKINKLNNINSYKMNLSFNPDKKLVYGKQIVNYINKSSNDLNEIYFHIYPNAFKKYDGNIKINDVKIDGKSAEYHIEGADKTLLRVQLKSKLLPNKDIKIAMNYSVKIPSTKDRFGYGNGIYAVGNFFPIAAVYKDAKWDKHLYDEKGDAFYSEVSNFDVNITAPKDYLIASSGVLDNKRSIQNSKTDWIIKGWNIRDFAFVTSDLFCQKKARVDGIMVKSYGIDAARTEKALEIGVKAMKYFNKSYGKYPYQTVSIAEAGMAPGVGGMEYPNLVMIGSDEYDNPSGLEYIVYNKSFSIKDEFYECIIHELAHQWWYALLGNDEYREAWIDEPMAQYSTLQYIRDTYGRKYYNTQFKIWNMYTKKIKNQNMVRPLNKFNDNEYEVLLYEKGPLMWKSLNDQVGDKKFTEFQRKLFETYKYKVADTNGVIDTASKVFNRDMSGFFDEWLRGEYK